MVTMDRKFFVQRKQFERFRAKLIRDAERVERGLQPDSHINKEYERSHVKIYKCGNHIETYEFQKALVLGRPVGGRIGQGHKSERSDENRKLTTRRARNTIRRLVNMNFSNRSKFVTLTFRDQPAANRLLTGEGTDEGAPEFSESETRAPERVEEINRGVGEGRGKEAIWSAVSEVGPTVGRSDQGNEAKTTEEPTAGFVDERERSPCESKFGCTIEGTAVRKRTVVAGAVDIRDVTQTNVEFKKFIQRLRRYMGKIGYNEKFPYIGVIEFQDKNDRGAVHYHVIMDIPYIDNAILAEIWSHGFVRVNRIEQCDNVGAYMVKYMTEDMKDERLQGGKAYLVSKGLQRPEVIVGELAHAEIQRIEKESKKKRVYADVYPSEFLGLISYNEYNTAQTIKGINSRKRK